jgi:hypothetical protein
MGHGVALSFQRDLDPTNFKSVAVHHATQVLLSNM